MISIILVDFVIFHSAHGARRYICSIYLFIESRGIARFCIIYSKRVSIFKVTRNQSFSHAVFLSPFELTLLAVDAVDAVVVAVLCVLMC